MRRVMMCCLVSVLAAGAVADGDEAGEEFAASFEVRADKIVGGAPMGFGFHLNEETERYAEGPIEFKLDAGPVQGGYRCFVAPGDVAFRVGLWHHVAVSWRQKGNQAYVWVDGDLIANCHTDTMKPPTAKMFLDAPKAKDDFPGEIRNVRTWKKIPSDAELLPKAVLDPIRKANLAYEAKLVAGYDGREPASGVLPIAIDRHARPKHVPFRTPADAKVLTGLNMAAAQGEFEDASFMLLPFRDFEGVDVRVSELKGAAGTIPADAFDVRIVKCWLQTRYGWSNFYTAGADAQALTPELLVHDDRLMVLDPKTHRNMLRISYPKEDMYVSVSTFEDPKKTGGFNFNLEPVRDAATFQPFAMEYGHTRQLWLTLRCPESAKGGDYRGTVTVSAGGKTLCAIPLALTVHPFKLPLAHCHYAPELPFLSTWMWHGNLSDKVAGYGGPGYELEKAQRRFYAELKNMAEHNCGWPWALLPPPSATSLLDYASMQLDYMKMAGCEMKPLFGGIGAGGDLAYRSGSDPKALDMSIPESRLAFEKEMIGYTNALKQLTRFVESKVGHREIAYYAFDEAKADYIRRCFPCFAALDYYGGISFTTGGDAPTAAFMTDLNDMADGFDLVRRVPAFNRNAIRRWHASGARVVTYASPHSGPECPDIWRRGRGLGAYFADTDGINEYIWYEAEHIWNDFVWGQQYRNFCMVYPTSDGVIDTIQWEAAREGLDDIRYFSYLNRLAQAAKGTKDKALADEAKRAIQWMELADWKKGDLDALRFGAAERIVKLNAALEKAGTRIALDYPARPEPFRAILPEPGAKESAAKLFEKAAAFEKAGACDIAVRFYTAAAERETKREAIKAAWAAAGDAAVKFRDRKTALACYEKCGSPAKKAMLALTADRLGWKPSPKEIAVNQRTIWNYGDATSKVRLIAALRDAGMDDEALEYAMRMYDGSRTGEIRLQTARIAAGILEKRGEMRKASVWYEKASAHEWPPNSAMMYKAGECAEKGKDYNRAIDCYTKHMEEFNGESRWMRKPIEARIARISKIMQSENGGPAANAMDGDNATEGLTLDE